ncbi:MAG: hypothetical protein HY835_09605 [Anaerolineae bacterium]|nr:hypothetical protein [Anaerolineae bacterium]
MRHKGLLKLMLTIIFCVNACQNATPTMDGLSLEVSAIGGQVEIQPAGKNSYQPLQDSQSVYPGDQIRTIGEKSFAELRDTRSLLVLGPQASLTAEKLSSTSDLTTTRLNLQNGSILVVAEQTLGAGYIEISLPNETIAVIQGSAMLVTMDSQTDSAIVTCVQDKAFVNSAGGSLTLPAGQSIILDSTGRAVQEKTMDQRIAERDPAMMMLMTNDRYLKYFPQMPAGSSTPNATLTPTRYRTSTRTPFATWTPYPTSETSTPSPVLAEVTRRPTVTMLPGAGRNDLTPEEKIHEGTHTYSVTCQILGADCVCDSALANPIVELSIVFDAGGVTLGSGDEQLRYEKVWANLYQVKTSETTSEITFLQNNWEFYVTKGGAACVLQSFTLR